MYQYYVVGRKVICVSTYAGKTVKGIAKCADDDEFDLEFGKALAKARCDFKVAKKRMRRAERVTREAQCDYMAAQYKLRDAITYLSDACAECDAAMENLTKLESH